MSIKWDPNVSSIIPKEELERAQKEAGQQKSQKGQSLKTPEGPARSDFLQEGKKSSPKDAMQNPMARDVPHEKEIDSLRASLHKNAASKARAAKAALSLAQSYPMRRSRAGRRAAISLLNVVAEQEPDFATPATELRYVLHAEGYLYTLSREATWRACRALVTLADDSKTYRSLARSTLASGMMQIAMHFPSASEELETPPPELLSKAFAIAEQAAADTPELADPHTMMGRLLLCHDDPEAWDDAITILERALKLDPEYDPAHIALATALFARGDLQGALQRVEEVINRGNHLPHTANIRGNLRLELGDPDSAYRDLERATKLAPEVGLFHLDAARAAEAAGDSASAQVHRQAAEQLLGKAGLEAAAVLLR